MYSPFSPLSLRKTSLLSFSVKHPNQEEMPFCPPYLCTPLHPSPEISGLSSSPGSQWPLSSPLTSLLIPMPGCRCTAAVCPVGQIRKIPVFSRGQKFLLVPWGCCAVVEQTQTRGGGQGLWCPSLCPAAKEHPAHEPGPVVAPRRPRPWNCSRCCPKIPVDHSCFYSVSLELTVGKPLKSEELKIVVL